MRAHALLDMETCPMTRVAGAPEREGFDENSQAKRDRGSWTADVQSDTCRHPRARYCHRFEASFSLETPRELDKEYVRFCQVWPKGVLTDGNFVVGCRWGWWEGRGGLVRVLFWRVRVTVVGRRFLVAGSVSGRYADPSVCVFMI